MEDGLESSVVDATGQFCSTGSSPQRVPGDGCTLLLFMRTTELHVNYFMFPGGREKESLSKRDINMKIYIKREPSSLQYAILNAPWQRMKNILLVLLQTHSLQFNLSSAFKLYAHWNTLLSSTLNFAVNIVRF